MTTPSDKEVHDFFWQHGYISGLEVLDNKEVQDLRDRFHEFEKEIGEEKAQYSLHNIHLQYEWVLRLCTHPRMLAPIKAILGPDLVLLDSRFICKYPNSVVPRQDGSEAFVAWHQDVKYWGVEGDEVSVWLAIDDADVDNGCMQVIPGTHKMELLDHGKSQDGGNLLSGNQELPEHLFDPSTAVPCPLKMGQMSLHHGHLIHGSGPNRSERRRCGYVIRYVRTSARPISDPNRPRTFPSTVHVCGQDSYKHWTQNQPDWFTWRQ